MHTEWGHDAVGPVVVAFVVSFNPSVQQSELFAAVCPCRPGHESVTRALARTNFYASSKRLGSPSLSAGSVGERLCKGHCPDDADCKTLSDPTVLTVGIDRLGSVTQLAAKHGDGQWFCPTS